MGGTSARKAQPTRSGDRTADRQHAAPFGCRPHRARRRLLRARRRDPRPRRQHRRHSDGVRDAGHRDHGPGDGHLRCVRRHPLRSRRHQHDDPPRRLPRTDIATRQHAAHRAGPIDGLQQARRGRPPDRAYPRRRGRSGQRSPRTRRHHHRAPSLQALDRHPRLGRAGVRDGGNARRRTGWSAWSAL